MEIKGPKSGATTAAPNLALVDQQIATLKDRFLPPYPHLLSVPTIHPYPRPQHWEVLNTPFNPRDVPFLQYMTLIAAERECAKPEGDWLERYDEGNGASIQSPWSAGAQSNAATPNLNRDPKRPKLSIADYKLKQSGVKPSSRPVTSTPTPDHKTTLGHSRNTSAMSLGTPMTRDPSLEGFVEIQEIGTSTFANPRSSESVPSIEQHSPALSRFNEPAIAENWRPTTNGNIEYQSQGSLPTKDSDRDSRPKPTKSANLPRAPLKHALPPKPPSVVASSGHISPLKNTFGIRTTPQKRPHDTSEMSQPEKRTKVESSRTPSDSHNQPNKKQDTISQTRPLPAKPQKSVTPRISPLKKTSDSEHPGMKEGSRRETWGEELPRELPALLSPLPADFDCGLPQQPTPSRLSKPKKADSDSASSNHTPNKPKLHSDTIVVKAPHASESSPLSTPPVSSQPKSRERSPFVLPAMLSPGLPQIVEDSLIFLQEKKTTPTPHHSSVERRHEQSRQPDALGVARKTVKTKPKIGHPPRKTQGESSKTRNSDVDERAVAEKSRLIVKLKYKKKDSKIIERYLHTRSKPTPEFLHLEKEREVISKRPVQSRHENEDSSGEDVPLSKVAGKAPATATMKRRNEFSTGPVAKRSKPPENLDASKTRTPATPLAGSSGTSQKILLSTPKKGEAMKSVQMRKVDSSDGHARTPQPTSTSTPASAEKPRANGTERRALASSAELEKYKEDEKKYHTLSQKLKHKMDDILRMKTGDRDSITEKDRKVGLATGIEALVAYMNAYTAIDRSSYYTTGRRGTRHWEGLIPFWIFIDREVKNYPVYFALNSALGALCREEVARSYIDSIEKNATDPQFLIHMRSNSKWTAKLWAVAHKEREALKAFGGDVVLGPWTDMKEVMAYAIGVLTAFSRKEQTGWKKDPAWV